MRAMFDAECTHGDGCAIHSAQVSDDISATCDRCLSVLVDPSRLASGRHFCEHGQGCWLDKNDASPTCWSCRQAWFGRGAPALSGYVPCRSEGWGHSCVRPKGHDERPFPTRHGAAYGAEWGP